METFSSSKVISFSKAFFTLETSFVLSRNALSGLTIGRLSLIFVYPLEIFSSILFTHTSVPSTSCSFFRLNIENSSTKSITARNINSPVSPKNALIGCEITAPIYPPPLNSDATSRVLLMCPLKLSKGTLTPSINTINRIDKIKI